MFSELAYFSTLDTGTFSHTYTIHTHVHYSNYHCIIFFNYTTHRWESDCGDGTSSTDHFVSSLTVYEQFRRIYWGKPSDAADVFLPLLYCVWERAFYSILVSVWPHGSFAAYPFYQKMILSVSAHPYPFLTKVLGNSTIPKSLSEFKCFLNFGGK